MSQLDLPHSRLVFGFEVTIESHVLVDRQRLTASMTRDQLKLGIGKTRVSGQPRYSLVPERVWVALTPASSAYLDTICWTRRVENLPCLGSERASGYAGGQRYAFSAPWRRTCRTARTCLSSLCLVDPDLAGFDINFGDSDVAEFTDSHRRVEEQPEHQGVLDILGTIDDLIEPPELLGGQNTGRRRSFFSGLRSQTWRTFFATYRQAS